MKCTFCKKGETKLQRVGCEHHNQKGNLVAVFKNFPAEVCQYCGEEYYQAKDMKRVETVLKKKARGEEIIQVRLVNF